MKDLKKENEDLRFLIQKLEVQLEICLERIANDHETIEELRGRK